MKLSDSVNAFVRLSITFLVFLSLFIATEHLSAEIHPKYYAEKQSEADEFLEIQVDLVKRRFSFSIRKTPLRVTATVVAVHRSENGLHIGDEITIEYEHFRPNRDWVGPRPIPILYRNHVYPAFLNWSDTEQVYIPAARGASFEPEIQLD